MMWGSPKPHVSLSYLHITPYVPAYPLYPLYLEVMCSTLDYEKRPHQQGSRAVIPATPWPSRVKGLEFILCVYRLRV